jgi:hypothetical protein
MSWQVLAKLSELVGTFLVLVPVYRSIYIHNRFMPLLRRADHRGRDSVLSPLGDIEDIARQLEVTVIARGITLTKLQYRCILFGSLLILAGGVMELVERAELRQPILDAGSALVSAARTWNWRSPLW